MNIIRTPIQSWVNKRGDGQFTPSDKDRNDIQIFDHEFLLKLHPGITQAAFRLRRNVATIVM